MTQCNGPAFNVESFEFHSEEFGKKYTAHCKGFVIFDQIEIANLFVEFFQQLIDCCDGRFDVTPALSSGPSARQKSRQRFKLMFADGPLARENQSGRSVADLARITDGQNSIFAEGRL